MHTYHIEESSVTAEEAIRATNYASYFVPFRVVKRLYAEITEKTNHIFEDAEMRRCFSVAAVWVAGRMQGIREERTRRKG
ncbi:MAG: hypothetical protein IKA47_08285 [Oscillospiraceae bacterium]|nr:hypothetical protein [Oscillospiraceae bacterium]